MVRIMLLFVLLSLAMTVQAKRIKMYPATPMLGQPVTLSMPADIPFIEKRFNWAALEKCFAVFDADYGSERVRFTLYPYRAGPCEIRQEKWETWEVPRHFDVRPNPHVSVTWTPPQQTLFVRQAIIWRAQVQLAQRSGYALSLDQPGRGDQHYRFGPEVDGTLAAVGWREQPGEMLLRSPFVTVKNPGGQKWRFPAPAVKATIQPLPRYLPANITVGQGALAWQTVPRMIAKGEVVPLQLVLRGQNLAPDWLPDVRDSLPAADGLRWLVGEKSLKTRWTSEGMEQQLVFTQPVMADRFGVVRLPPVVLRLFDPATRKLTDLQTVPHTIWVLPGWLILLIKGVLGLLMFLISTGALMLAWMSGWRLWLELQRRRRQGKPLWQAMQLYHRWCCPWRKPQYVQTPQAWLAAHPLLNSGWQKTVTQLYAILYANN